MRGGASDESLVRRAQRGDAEAFSDLVTRHRGRVYAVTLRLCRNPADAEDALQDTFLSAYRALGSFTRRARFSTWLYRIAVNAAYDTIARRSTTTELDDADTHRTSAPDPYAQDETRRALEAGLASLEQEFREAVVLCDIAGLGASEAAAVLGVPAGTVKSRVFRGRAALAVMLREPAGLDRVEQDGEADAI
jgi:RNA polymerase sigma-70 factor, ECF subfamily